MTQSLASRNLLSSAQATKSYFNSRRRFQERNKETTGQNRTHQAGGSPREQRDILWSNSAHKERVEGGGWTGPGEGMAMSYFAPQLTAPSAVRDCKQIGKLHTCTM